MFERNLNFGDMFEWYLFADLLGSWLCEQADPVIF